MHRCVRAAFVAALVVHAGAIPIASAQAPVHRTFSATALRGDLTVLQTPEALINGQPARLAPGARIRGENNLLMLPGALAGQTVRVHYTLESQTGLIRDVWILNSTERAKSPWPSTVQEASTWRFDPSAQTWSRP